MRIIAGKYRSRAIEQPKTDKTRPTTDKVREAIFSSIQFDLQDSVFLDLFSGSGAFAIEAVSRGAMKAIAIEKDRDAFLTLSKNLKSLHVSNVDIHKIDALSYLSSSKGLKYDFIFMDAPFAEYDLINNCLNSIKTNQIVSKNGLVILETDNPEQIKLPSGMVVQKSKKYGKINVLFIAEF
ncbi:16S rRNA (guanine(966)-N(2))-methyltransferase RsmD [Mycoplasma sp. Ms02]|uniref:16S rRNA (guanine(966)-N(2))-methyltransferase RsmD n=1 Tax=Mycoplasma sp. Ms02 TaxID=353851 RepID=UPI00351D8644